MEERFTFSCLDGSKKSVIEVFQKCLVGSGLGGNVPRYRPLETTAELVANLGARCAVVQRNVQDPDFLAEHAAYYSRWTSDVPRYCHRIHFFSMAPTAELILEVIDELATAADCYLGFVTLRPISISPVAATILKPTGDSQRFLLSKDAFQVNIAGRTFFVAGTPFMQQDNAVGACAQASIWMALRTLRKKEGQAAFSPAQITTAATKFLVMRRTLPNRGGLSLEQVSEALREAGYAPHAIPLWPISNKSAPSEQQLGEFKCTLYPYVESGIPVLLLLSANGLEGHAVVVIGHHWDEKPAILIKRKPIFVGPIKAEIFDAASWIAPFIIHNDNSGPYLPLPDKAVGDWCLAQARFAIPLLHPDVFTDAKEAQEATFRLLSQTMGICAGTSKNQGDSANELQLVMRTFLQERSEFRAFVFDSDLPVEVKNYYRLKWFPKRLWVTELNAFDDYSEAPTRPKIRLGEILTDPAAEAEEGAFLAVRLGEELLRCKGRGIEGIVIDRDALDGSIKAFPVPGHRVTPLVRESI